MATAPAASSSAGNGPSGGSRLPVHQIWGSVEVSENSSEHSHQQRRGLAPGIVVLSESDDASLSSRSDGFYGFTAGLSEAEDDEADGRQEAVPGDRKPEWSEGAKLHEEGQCKPCAWHWRPSGCVNGANCTFCHTCEEGALKARKKERMSAMKAQTPQQMRRRMWARRNIESKQNTQIAGASASPLMPGLVTGPRPGTLSL
mmetsp:Transcript_5387/g.11915  ORF Transcript_5387/g.11915 Transcript_5387/m.11915 type:complete len:201 (+) Transcript_5387:74-676(+)